MCLSPGACWSYHKHMVAPFSNSWFMSQILWLCFFTACKQVTHISNISMVVPGFLSSNIVPIHSQALQSGSKFWYTYLFFSCKQGQGTVHTAMTSWPISLTIYIELRKCIKVYYILLNHYVYIYSSNSVKSCNVKWRHYAEVENNNSSMYSIMYL